jgi:hypothetical protein
MDVTSATNTRTLIAATFPLMPSGNKVPVLQQQGRLEQELTLLLNSFGFDFVMRRRLSGLSVNFFIIEEAPLPPRALFDAQMLRSVVESLCAPSPLFADRWMEHGSTRVSAWRSMWSLSNVDRLRRRCVADSLAAAAFGLDSDSLRTVLAECDQSDVAASNDPKGFWRVDKEKDPELRHTVLTLIAFADLESKTREVGGDSEKGIEAFLNQNDGEGWMLPETLRLSDYGLGHDERAKHHQPVASRLGPRFYDWQLAQTAEESWRECEIHAKNLEAASLSANTASASAGEVEAQQPARGRRKTSATTGPDLFSFPSDSE